MNQRKVLVTGATGFIGRHVVKSLLARGFAVRAVARDVQKARALPWFDAVEFVAADIHGPDVDVRGLSDGVDALVHLAWPGLPDYAGLFHFETTLPADYAFIKAVVESGVPQVLVTGTCFEYGLQSGPLSESTPAQPTNPYGLAKNTLRTFLEALNRVTPFTLQWARMFYLHGEGQNPRSLLASLERAIDAGDTQFNMSRGDQLRDYLAVEQAADCLVTILQQREFAGIVNCSSGRPVSVRALVEDYLAARGVQMTLNLGHYGYSVHEPMAFWGINDRLLQLMGNDDVA
ncbi:NAD-dependent epimerase/dehydratase family protein [Pseudomonas sp. NPDC090202]|uniref:NAD-dependent epimerase/dehydratase family protein n=1 Tax=unclassified Pseudomonas TaxID=196821 RepID=UPI0037F32E52